MFPKIGLPQNGWFIMFIMENPIKMDDLGTAHYASHAWRKLSCSFGQNAQRSGKPPSSWAQEACKLSSCSYGHFFFEKITLDLPTSVEKSVFV